MNGNQKVWAHQKTTPNPSVNDILASEQGLSYEDRVRKALNLGPYLNYLNDLFAQKLSDSESEDDEGSELLPPPPQEETLKSEHDSKCPAITHAIHTLNLNLEETLSPSSNYLSQVTGKSESESSNLVSFPLPSESPFSHHNSYSSSIPGLSPTGSSDNDKHDDTGGSELTPISDLELHKYLERPVHGLSSSPDEDIISLLSSTNQDFKSHRKRKWEPSKLGHSSHLSDSVPSSPGCSNSLGVIKSETKSFPTASTDFNPEELVGIGLDVVDEKETTIKIKEDPDKLLTESYDDFSACLKSSSSHDNKLNLNQTADFERDDHEGEDGDEEDGNEGMDDDDDESLSEYMNITANATLALDSYFKFDADDLTSAAQSPASPTASLPPGAFTSSTLTTLTEEDEDDVNAEKGLGSLSENQSRKAKRMSLQKQARMVQILNIKRRKIYIHICKKEVTKAQRVRANTHKEMLVQTRCLAHMCANHLRNEAIQSQSLTKDYVWRAKRLAREMQAIWKQTDRAEREIKRRKDKEAVEQKRLDMELTEAKRQQRKLNFLTVQAELYAHLMSKKLNGIDPLTDEETLLNEISELKISKLRFPVDSDSELQPKTVARNVEKAYQQHKAHIQKFCIDNHLFNFSESVMKTTSTQPIMFNGGLKNYQLEGMNWLINLFSQGINGILADETGLGKTVQSLAFLAHLAEGHGAWGPFVIIVPTELLHNWQQEFLRFVPRFAFCSYWGNPQERKILRDSWRENCFTGVETAKLHVVITSYQVFAADMKYFSRVKWQYLILDEAQSVKSNSRWKSILSLNCRNRLLLTGSLNQNTLRQLWQLLNLVMPEIFDYQDLSACDWFSKQVTESSLYPTDEYKFADLTHLQQILECYTLKRVRKDVEKELPEISEIILSCGLSTRQRLLYSGLQKNIRIEELLKPSGSNFSAQYPGNLMNLVVQFRKICNHPNLVEKQDIKSPCYMHRILNLYPKIVLRDGLLHLSERKKRLLNNTFSIYNPIHTSGSFRITKPASFVEDLGIGSIEFSFTRFIDLSPTEFYDLFYGGNFSRWNHILKMYKLYQSLFQNKLWKEEEEPSKYLTANDMILSPYSVTSFPSIENSPVLQALVFLSQNTPTYCLCDPSKYWKSIPETDDTQSRSQKNQQMTGGIEKLPDETQIGTFLITKFLPLLLNKFPIYPKVVSAGIDISSRDMDALDWFKGQRKWANLLSDKLVVPYSIFSSVELTGLEAAQPRNGWSNIVLPDYAGLVTDSGKLYALDQLLKKLKGNGHRVLICTQMTRMINILEEYIHRQKWKYFRLDGFSKVSNTRAMLAKFQSDTDFHIFLLSTRGITLMTNLTFVNTVIFYDSDWNPLIDQQVIDRVHGLGQTDKVTIYRLICKETMEESILHQAKDKFQTQKTYDVGSSLEWDTLKPKELVSLLLDDEGMKTQYNDEIRSSKNKYLEMKSSTQTRFGKFIRESGSFRRFRGIEISEPTSSIGSSGSVAESSPGNSDLYVGEECDPELLEEDLELDSEEEEGSYQLQDIDCVDGPLPISSRFTTECTEWNTGLNSDCEDGISTVSDHPKIGRGGGRRGRPPTRVRCISREEDGSRRGRPVGRPRLKRVGPPNQGVRGRRPGRPPLTKKAETLSSSSISMTPSQSIFGFYSSPGMDTS